MTTPNQLEDAGQTGEPVETAPLEYAVEASSPRPRLVGARTVLTVALLVVVVAAAVYDLRYVPDEYAFTVRMTARDWMLVGCLVLIAHATAPLARRPKRLLAYWRRYPKDVPSLLGLGIVSTFVLVGFLGPIVFDPPQVDIFSRYQPPAFTSVREPLVTNCVGETTAGRCHGSLEHPFGTEKEGRDVFTYVVYGTRTSLEMALLVTTIAVPIATVVGTFAAYAGGRVDQLLMRYVDAQQIVPAFFVYFVLLFVYKPSQTMLILVFGLLSWGGVARVVRSEVKRERERQYVMAARNAGAGTAYTIRRHVWPNVAGTILTAATLQIPFLITIEAALSFIDLGDELVFSWGKIIADGSEEVHFRPWVTLIPGAILAATILGFYLFGDALQRTVDPRDE